MKTLWMALALIILTHSAFAGVEINLERNVVVESEYMKLSDIATLKGEAAEQLGKVFLGPAPRRGTSMKILRTDIMQRLKGMGLGQDVSFTGNLGVSVGRGGEVIAAATKIRPAYGSVDRNNTQVEKRFDNRSTRPDVDQISTGKYENYLAKAENANALELIRQAIKSYVGERLDEAMPVIMQTKVSRYNLDGSCGDYATVEGVERGELPGRATLAVVFSGINGQVTGYASVDVVVKMEVDLPVLARSIRSGEAVRQQDVIIQRVEYKPGMSIENITAEDLAGRIALKSIRSGVQLSAAFFGRPLDIQKGQLITVCIEGNGFTIKEMALALGNGSVGETVSVESVVSKSVYPVRVTGRNMADMPINTL